MKIQVNIRTLVAMVMLTLALGTHALAQAANASIATEKGTPVASPVHRRIMVSLEDRKLALLENGAVKKIYAVAVGKPSTPSPVGSFTIERRVANPTYSHKGQRVEPGPGNPVGTRWMGLNVRGYGIHGTNAPNSIGKAVSHGCIRMSRADLEELFELVRAGDEFEMVGQRNEETAQVSAAPTLPAASTANLQTAQAVVPAPADTHSGAASAEAVSTAQTAGPVNSRQ